MNPRRLHQALAVALLFGAASMAGAQTSSNSAGSTTGNTGTPPASKATSAESGKHAASAAHHAHARMHSRSGSTRDNESPYHAALKQCVEGPANQRDHCIDQAINQYGRS